jgi:ribosomal protein S27AE
MSNRQHLFGLVANGQYWAVDLINEKHTIYEYYVEEEKKIDEKEFNCDTCEDTGEVMMMVCYGGPPIESKSSCPDCGSGMVYND